MELFFRKLNMKIIGLFLAFLTIVGVIEFLVSSYIITNQLSALAVEGEVVHIGIIFAEWFKNVIFHLVIDVIVSAISTFVFEALFSK